MANLKPNNRIRSIRQIDDSTPEGKMLLMAISKLSVINNNYKGTDKTPDEIIAQINKTVDKVYYSPVQP